MSFSRLHILFLACLISFAVTETPVSSCLGNCIACPLLSPSVCLPLLDQGTGIIYPCLTYYTGPNCTKTADIYYNFYKQNGPFLNWSLPTPPPSAKCSLINRVNGVAKTLDSSFNSIGPFSSSLNATKSLQFSEAQSINHLIIKLVVAISDAILSSSNSDSSYPGLNQTVDSQGNAIIKTLSTNSTNSSQPIPFLTMTITDILNSNAILTSRNTSYDYKSLVQTSCGYIYQYQFMVDSNNGSILQQLVINLYQQSNSAVTWNLLDFTVEGGCSGFTVSSSADQCDSCLGGFYPQYDVDNSTLYGCSICDYRCNTCFDITTCLLCEAYSTLNITTGLCDFPSDYVIYNSSFKVNTGSTPKTSNSQLKGIIQSKNQIMNISRSLRNNQSYLVKFYLLYTSNYVNNLNNITVKINGQTLSTLTALDQSTSTLDSSNDAASPLFIKQLKFDLMNQPVSSNFSLFINGSSPASEQFYLVDLVIVQYQCIRNCLKCSFSALQTTACTQCLPFFSLSLNCRSCANGFFSRNDTICVKCYSSCKQCNGPSSYGCTDCYDLFELSDFLYDQSCAQCLYSFYNNKVSNCSSQCQNNYTVATLNQNKNCTVCMQASKSQIFYKLQCTNCWLALGLGNGKCSPTSQSGYIFYASDLNSGQAASDDWKGSQPLVNYNCTQDYTNLLGIPATPNKTQAIPSNIVYTIKGFPGHLGLIFALNIFKIDQWAHFSSSLFISIAIKSPNSQAVTYNNTFTNSYGGNICGGSGNQMIWALQIKLSSHSDSQVTFNISSSDQGIFVRQLQLFLGNCLTCQSISLSFTLQMLPMYSDNDTQTGLDVWVKFNHPVSLLNSSNQSISQQTPYITQLISASYVQASADSFANSFGFSLDQNQIYNVSILQNSLLNNSYIKFFLPLNSSYINSTLVAKTTEGGSIYSQDGNVPRYLISSSQSILLSRFHDVSSDSRQSMSRLADFFLFFTWFALIVMILCVLMGVGVVFEQFLLMMQVIYLHIYITSAILPPSMKIPLSSATRMQHLNYFSNIRSIQDSLFDGILIPSNYIFTQYNVDVYFLRSIYPVLIINAVYIGWFIIWRLVYMLVPAFRDSQNKLIRFLKSIPIRPLAYFDQIWRYQFLTIMWAASMQFTNFSAQNSGQTVNLVICVIAFIISVTWPIVVSIYLYKRHFTTNVNSMRYLYHDIFYLKISSLADEPKYFLYTIVKAARLFLYAFFIGLSINQSIIGPVILIFANLSDCVYIYFLDIYRDALYLATRIIQNLLLSVAAVLCLVIFGYIESTDFSQDSYQNIGFGVDTIFVLAIINGILRVFYLAYKKILEWRLTNYDVGEQGQKQKYDFLDPLKIPESERK